MVKPYRLMGPSTELALRRFEYRHLPEEIQAVSKKFHDLAWAMADMLPDDPELVAGLRKLAEAKDCIVFLAIWTDSGPVDTERKEGP